MGYGPSPRAAVEDVETCAGAVPGSVPTVCVLTVTETEQRARIFRRAQHEYGMDYGGGSTNQTLEALEESLLMPPKSSLCRSRSKVLWFWTPSAWAYERSRAECSRQQVGQVAK